MTYGEEITKRLKHLFDGIKNGNDREIFFDTIKDDMPHRMSKKDALQYYTEKIRGIYESES